MSESGAKTETLVGLFLLIGLGLLAGLVVIFGRFEDRFADHYTLTVVFDDAAGLIKGSEVRMGGARIGKVGSEPKLTEQVKVEVPLKIVEDIHIPEDSVFQISSASILGDKLIVITPPAEPSGSLIQPGSLIEGGGPYGLEAIQNNAVAVSRDVRDLLAQAGETLGSIDTAVRDIEAASGDLRQTLGKVNDGLLSAENLDHLRSTLANLDQASAGLTPLLSDVGKVVADVDQAAIEARGTFAKASERMDELEPALRDVPNAVESLSQAANQAADTLERVDQGKGLLGTLTHDEGISEDIKKFMHNLRRDGVLRYRDEELEGPEEDPRARFQSRRR